MKVLKYYGLVDKMLLKNTQRQNASYVLLSQSFTLRSIFFAPLFTADAVNTTIGWDPTILSANDSAENPANTTEWMAPILAQANCTTECVNLYGPQALSSTSTK